MIDVGQPAREAGQPTRERAQPAAADSLLPVRALEPLLRAAAVAPLFGQSRPWELHVNPDYRVIDLYAKPSDEVRQADPNGRSVHVAAGMVLFNLRIAALASGHEPVARLLPSRTDPLLLASVRLAGPHRTRGAEYLLWDALGVARRTLAGSARHGLTDYRTHAPWPARVLAELAGAAAIEGVVLHVLDPAAISGVVTLSAPEGARLAVLSMPYATRGAAQRADWLRAGQAAQRVLLLAATHNVAAAPLTRAFAEPGPRLIAALAGHDIAQPLVVVVLRGQPSVPDPRPSVRLRAAAGDRDEGPAAPWLSPTTTPRAAVI